MNKGAASRKRPRRRSYDNTLRVELAQQTRQRILDAAVAELANTQGVTLAQVARAAGVSEPTLYRHFGSREKLLEEIELHAHGQLGLPPMTESVAGLPAQATALFEKFEEHKDLLSAVVHVGVGKEMRATGRKRRTQMLRDMIARSAPHLDAAELDRITAVMRVLVSWESYHTMTGELGLSPEDARHAVAWALESLVSAIEKQKPNDRARRAAKRNPKGGTR